MAKLFCSPKCFLSFSFSIHFYSTLNYAGKIVHFRRCVWSRIVRRGFEMLCIQRRLKRIPSIFSDGGSDKAAVATTIEQYGCGGEMAIHTLR